MSIAPRIFTIGYESRTQAEFIDRLASAGVRVLADIRALPLSRRPGFSKNGLAAALAEAGIDYLSLKALGTPPEGRAAARRHDLSTLARIYSGQLATPAAIAEAARLRALAAETPTALMCVEHDAADCHRRLLTDAEFTDFDVVDL